MSLRGLELCIISSICLSRESLGGTKDNILPNEGLLILPPGKEINFSRKQTKKIEVVARPVVLFGLTASH